jgi:secreted Zn-dependent insulinase-like peptidase
VLEAVTSTAIDPQRFAVLRDELLRDWRNYRDERPYTQAYGALGYLLLSNRWPPEMLIETLQDITPEDLARWRDARTARFHVLGLDHGNVPVEGAWALAAALQEHLTLGAFPRQTPRVVELDGARRYPLDIDHQDAAMVLYLQDPDDTVESRARSALAASILRQAYFTSLRTEQQLGYVVALNNQTLRNRGGLAFIVQSPVASSAELERVTQAFVTAQVDAVNAMPEDAFASYQQGLIARLTEKDRNLVERGRRLWTNLELGVTTFDSDAQLAAAVERLGKADVVNFLATSTARFEEDRLLVYSSGQFDEAPVGGRALDDIRAFKAAR